jgi:quercetin dioxygenase-like cupin family protein
MNDELAHRAGFAPPDTRPARPKARTLLTAAALALTAAIPVPGLAQPAAPPAPSTTAPPAPPATAPAPPEILFSNAQAQVKRFVLAPGAATPSHTHAQVHLAIALDGGEIVDVGSDGTERRATIPEGGMRYVPAGVTHVLRNAGSAPFRAVTIDLLQPQSGARNRCGRMVSDQPGDCPGKAGAPGKDTLVPQMETDQTVVSLLTLASGAEHHFKGAPQPPVVVALQGTDAKAMVTIDIPGAVGKGEKPLGGGDVTSTLPKSPLTLRNTGATLARFVVVEFRK